MKVLLTGAAGQVGRALTASVPEGMNLLSSDRSALDITDDGAIRNAVRELRPEVILNAAAYTAVDRAESDVEGARRVNVDGARTLAEAAAIIPGCRLIHISTDFVFDGSHSLPYRPDDRTAPLSVYGSTKLAGEHAVTTTLKERSVILRTSWLYDATGRNFLNTMLRLMREGRALRVVADQVGTPTAAHSVAAVLWRFASKPGLSGVWHWSDGGVASWYDFAMAIGEEAAVLGLLPGEPAITPISTAEYPTPARRPAFSVLDKQQTVAALGVMPVHWRKNLRQVLKEMALA